ncbi:hypothetical protein POM88_029603 [Heracleum sosnowskyi]|uniref:TF-B3 domain-containing protein n=1 Tax=Heracleum sosnowskyi TaxID=360622 RepID=A0AAD8MF09_9APIA|nr:hypothetical protein POM88_029603 [Heracleum sosnowskyi]
MEAAALMLVSLTYLEVDQKTAQDMEKQRNEAIREAILSDRPWLPPVPSVKPFIGKCSKAIKKQLEDSDVKDNQARLSLKKDSVVKEFLPVLKSYENVKDGIEVIAYDSYGNKYERMKFILWADKMYVFTRQWKQFCEDHKLVSYNDGVKVWMFRDNRTDKLCVVIKPIFDQSLSLAERDFRRMSLNEKTS